MSTSKSTKPSTAFEPQTDVAVPGSPRAQKLFVRIQKARAATAKLNARLEEIERNHRQRLKRADIKARQRLYFVLGKYVYDALNEGGTWLGLKLGDVAFRETLGPRDLDRFVKILGQNAVEQDFSDEDDAANEGTFDQDDLDSPPGDAQPDEDDAA